MALVSEMVTPGGVRVRVFDDLYRDASPEEIKRRRDAVYRAMVRMIAEREEREQHEKELPSGVADRRARKGDVIDDDSFQPHCTSFTDQSQGRQSAPTSPP